MLVLDMNGLLLWRARRDDFDLTQLPCRPDATAGQFHIFRRPHLRDFLAWCSERFLLVVWSTAMGKNLAPMVQCAFAAQGLSPPVAVLGQSDCTDTGEVHPDGSGKALVLKELSRLWADARVVSAIGAYGPTDTLLLDDSPYKAARNPRHTALHPKEWLGPADAWGRADAALGPAGAIRDVLAAIADADDVRDVVARLFAQKDASGMGKAERCWTDADECTLLRELRARRPDLQPAEAAPAATPPGVYDDAAAANILGMLGVS